MAGTEPGVSGSLHKAVIPLWFPWSLHLVVPVTWNVTGGQSIEEGREVLIQRTGSTRRSLPHPGYCKEHCREHSGADTFSNSGLGISSDKKAQSLDRKVVLFLIF